MATSTIQTDDNDDLFLADGRNLVILSGAPALSQNVRHATLMRLGEDQFDVSNGVDYLGAIFTPQPDFDLARKSIVDAIQKKPDVSSVESMEITLNGDQFEFVAEYSSVYGTLKVSN